MQPDPSSLRALRGVRASRPRGGAESVPTPRRRWLLRVGVPLLIVLCTALLLAWSLRDALVPLPRVDAVPAILVVRDTDLSRTSGGEGSADEGGRRSAPVIVAQAPGWIEPDPFAITVQSMVPGVVAEVLVLEGQRVSTGDPLVRLDARDAELALRAANAELAELVAEVDGAVAGIAGAESRVAELADELSRIGPLRDLGGVPEGQIVRLEHRLRTHERDLDVARAARVRAEAAVERQRVAVAQAELALHRHTIVAPTDGVVLVRSVVPGTRISMAGDGPGEAHEPGLLTLYDPAALQVRADVPIADAGLIGLGTQARISTEALPDREFDATVTRIVHRADVQRNTVQAKLRILKPDPLMRPEMLVRVRLLGTGTPDALADGQRTAGGAAADEASMHAWLPADALCDRDGERATVWVALPAARRGVRTVHPRPVIVVAEREDGVVVEGVRAGDRVVIAPGTTLRDGMSVRLRGADAPQGGE